MRLVALFVVYLTAVLVSACVPTAAPSGGPNTWQRFAAAEEARRRGVPETASSRRPDRPTACPGSGRSCGRTLTARLDPVPDGALVAPAALAFAGVPVVGDHKAAGGRRTDAGRRRLGRGPIARAVTPRASTVTGACRLGDGRRRAGAEHAEGGSAQGPIAVRPSTPSAPSSTASRNEASAHRPAVARARAAPPGAAGGRRRRRARRAGRESGERPAQRRAGPCRRAPSRARRSCRWSSVSTFVEVTGSFEKDTRNGQRSKDSAWQTTVGADLGVSGELTLSGGLTYAGVGTNAPYSGGGGRGRAA